MLETVDAVKSVNKIFRKNKGKGTHAQSMHHS
jgi:hypothetical protein